MRFQRNTCGKMKRLPTLSHFIKWCFFNNRLRFYPDFRTHTNQSIRICMQNANISRIFSRLRERNSKITWSTMEHGARMEWSGFALRFNWKSSNILSIVFAFRCACVCLTFSISVFTKIDSNIKRLPNLTKIGKKALNQLFFAHTFQTVYFGSLACWLWNI